MPSMTDNWYESMTEVVDTLRELDRSDVANRVTAKPHDERNDPGASWDEALELAERGWRVDRDVIDRDVERVLEQVADRLNAHVDAAFREVHDVSGGYVDVARYLDGEPECMVEQWMDPAPKRGKVIKLLNNCVAPWFVEADVLRQRGRAVAVAVEVLYRLGFTIELWTGESVKSYDGKAYAVEMVKVKDAADPMDWDAIMFAMAHPAMLRQVSFGLNETRPDTERNKFGFHTGSGYGSCTEFPESISEQFDIVLEQQTTNTFSTEQFIERVLVTAESDRIDDVEV